MISCTRGYKNVKPRIYTDTSVIGGCFDVEFEKYSQQLIDVFIRGLATMILSDLTIQELQGAPTKVRAIVNKIPDKYIEFVEFTNEASDLADQYIACGVAVEKNRVDAQHVAIATVMRVDLLVSWNFKHIVRLDRIRLYNSVNLRYGYPIMEIRSPREVQFYDEE
jgi:hypothetical protein